MSLALALVAWRPAPWAVAVVAPQLPPLLLAPYPLQWGVLLGSRLLQQLEGWRVLLRGGLPCVRVMRYPLGAREPVGGLLCSLRVMACPQVRWEGGWGVHCPSLQASPMALQLGTGEGGLCCWVGAQLGAVVGACPSSLAPLAAVAVAVGRWCFSLQAALGPVAVCPLAVALRGGQGAQVGRFCSPLAPPLLALLEASPLPLGWGQWPPPPAAAAAAGVATLL